MDMNTFSMLGLLSMVVAGVKAFSSLKLTAKFDNGEVSGMEEDLILDKIRVSKSVAYLAVLVGVALLLGSFWE